MNIEFNFNNSGDNIYINGNLVGRICLRENTETITISSISININHRNNGYGKAVVNYLKSKGKLIVGESAPLSIGFWRKMGAVFEFDINETNEEEIYRLLDNDIYPSFIIERS